jgi:hypothetical protein
LGAKYFSWTLPDDVEMLQMFAAFAGSTFFAYCHLVNGDVKVDFFTHNLTQRNVTAMAALQNRPGLLKNGLDPCAPHIARESPRRDGGCFQFDLAGAIEQISDENHAHRRIMAACVLAPDRSQLAARAKLRWLVAAVSSHAANVARFAACDGQNREYVFRACSNCAASASNWKCCCASQPTWPPRKRFARR